MIRMHTDVWEALLHMTSGEILKQALFSHSTSLIMVTRCWLPTQPALCANSLFSGPVTWPPGAPLPLCACSHLRGHCCPTSCQVFEPHPHPNSATFSMKRSLLLTNTSGLELQLYLPRDDAKRMCDFKEITLLSALFYSSVKLWQSYQNHRLTVRIKWNNVDEVLVSFKK